MHEYGLIKSIARAAEDECRKASGDELKSITIQVGRFSGYEADHISDCFDILREENHFFKMTKLYIEKKDSEAACPGCRHCFTAENEIALCPKCGRISAIDMRDALVLKSVEIKND